MNLGGVLQDAVMQGASDIHFCSRQSPWIRVQGELFKLNQAEHEQQNDQDSDELLDALSPYIDMHLATRLSQGYEIDFSFAVAGLGRFRANVFKSHRGIGAVLRHIRDAIPSLAEINTLRYCQIYFKALGCSWSPVQQALGNLLPWRLFCSTSITPRGNTSSQLRTQLNSYIPISNVA